MLKDIFYVLATDSCPTALNNSLAAINACFLAWMADGQASRISQGRSIAAKALLNKAQALGPWPNRHQTGMQLDSSLFGANLLQASVQASMALARNHCGKRPAA